MYKKIVYLPIETKPRELDSKTLVALSCIDKDMAVVICSSRYPLHKFRIPGVVLLKSAAGFEYEYIDSLKQVNKLCCVLDEEGLVHTNNEREHALRFSQATVDILSGIFFNGKKEQEVLSNFYNIPQDKSVITGNSRFDIYKKRFHSYYESDVVELKQKYGQFIIIPSRFSTVSLAMGDGTDEAFLNFLKSFYVNCEEDLAIYRGLWEHDRRLFEKFVSLLPVLRKKFPDYKIIIRPHPSESPERWLEAASGLENIELINSGPIGPWLAAAEAVVHNGCTTGLEAFLLGKPVFSYMPYISNEYDLELPNDVSIKCFTEDDLIASMSVELRKHSTEAPLDESKLILAEQYLFNAGDEYAYENIAIQMEKISSELPKVSIDALISPLDIRLKNLLKKLLAKLVPIASNLMIPMPIVLNKLAYSYQKNPGFSKTEISASLHKFSIITGINLENLQVKKIDEDAFVIYK